MYIAEILDTHRSPEWLGHMVACGLWRAPGSNAPRYLAALDRAVRDEPPPFCLPAYDAMYRTAASEIGWLAVSLIRNAERDGDTARRLWTLAAGAPRTGDAVMLERHAVTKSDHVFKHLDILSLVCPGMIADDLRAGLVGLSPGYSLSSSPAALDGPPAQAVSTRDLLDANVAALRTIGLQILCRPAALAHCPDVNVAAVERAIDDIVGDDATFLAGTARSLDAAMSAVSPAAAAAWVTDSLRRLNRVTGDELIDLDYNVRFGNYP